MWSNTVSGKMGAASDGKMPWYDATKIFDIFTYCAQCNTAALAGYSDWRVANVFELFSLSNVQPATAVPNGTAFPSWPSSTVHSSSTSAATYVLQVDFGYPLIGQVTKTTAEHVALVRGGM
jgi:hypothetical protein